MMSKPTLVVDFDGVLHSYSSGWHGAATVSDGPVDGAIEFLTAAVKAFDVCISSSRSHEAGGREAMREALAKWGLGQDILDQIAFPTVKPAAFVTLDDRAIQFDGTWPDISALLAFKPWNKR